MYMSVLGSLEMVQVMDPWLKDSEQAKMDGNAIFFLRSIIAIK